MSSSRVSSPTKRILKELQSYPEDPNPALLHLQPDSDADLLHLTTVMKGPSDSAYSSGLWELDIHVPPNYPNAPPTVKFVTPICHPNVHFKTGEICLDLLKTSWTPAYTISSTLGAIHQMLAYPEPDSPLNVDVAVLLRSGDLIGAESLIRWCCKEWRWDGR